MRETIMWRGKEAILPTRGAHGSITAVFQRQWTLDSEGAFIRELIKDLSVIGYF